MMQFSNAELFQSIFYFLILLALIKPVGWYMAQVYEGNHDGFIKILNPIEDFFYRLCDIDPRETMDWKKYLITMLVFNFLGFLVVYLTQRFQAHLPLNPQHFGAPAPHQAFNTAASFISNTNWQSYSGETTLSYLTQMLALTTQNFLSAATGMSILVALIRGIRQQGIESLGNFWVDLVRSVIYILLPLSIVLALTLVSQGVIQNFKPNLEIHTLEKYETTQVIPMGPVASQVAIKQLGSNGGGFFNVNAAHPFENPTPLTNLLEMIAILLIPAAFCYTFGVMVGDKRQGWALISTMLFILIPFVSLAIVAERVGNPAINALDIYPPINLEGKETRFGVINSALWTTLTTATSNGSVNSMLDSYTPIGGFVPLWMMHLGEVVFGGVGTGLYGMLMLIIITVFVTGLMVGRSPEYLGKKIEPYEIKMASMVVLIMPLVVLLATSISAVLPAGIEAINNPGPHGLSEILYAFTSMGNTNGSAFAGLKANTPFYNMMGGIVMLVSRYWIAIPVLAIAGSLARKKTMPTTSGTLATHTPLFMILLICVTLIIGGLSFLPTLALGPIVENMQLWSSYGH